MFGIFQLSEGCRSPGKPEKAEEGPETSENSDVLLTIVQVRGIF